MASTTAMLGGLLFKTLAVVYLWVPALLVESSDILPWSPEEDEGLAEGLQESLNHLKETLLDYPQCDDRLEKMWKDFGRRTAIIEEKKDQMTKMLDDLSIIMDKYPPLEKCGKDFKKAGDSCFHILDKTWPWWRTRQYCLLVGGELVHPRDLDSLKEFLKTKENSTFWIGGRTSNNLEFPEWKTPEGHWVFSENENFTTIPRNSPEDNCLAIDGSDGYQMKANNCEEKLSTVCKEKFKECDVLFTKVGKVCLMLHWYFAKSWSKAKEYCPEYWKARLPVIYDFKEMQNYVAQRARSAGKPEDWKIWTAGKMNQGRLEWPDGTLVNLTLSTHKDEDRRSGCLALTSGEYSTAIVDCSDELGYICALWWQ